MSAVRRVAACLLTLVAFGALPATASAELIPSELKLEVLDTAGAVDTRAGAHPDRLVERFSVTNTGGPAEHIKEMLFGLSRGLGGAVTAVPLCPRVQVSSALRDCPPESQVGELRSGVEAFPIHAVGSGPNEPVTFGVDTNGPPLIFAGRLTPEQSIGLTLGGLEPSTRRFDEGVLELWGVPADRQQGTSIPRRPLLTTPTRCDNGPMRMTMSLRTWESPARLTSGSGGSDQPLTDCADLPFDPRFGLDLGGAVADSTGGATIELVVPQREDPDGLATAHVRDVDVRLPEGMTLAPGGAIGLDSCSEAELGLGSDAEARCPGSSKVGTVKMATPQLGERSFAGNVYFGESRPGDRFRLFVAASGMGSQVKLIGSLLTDPQTGQLTARLAGLPEASFAKLELRFDGGPQALLATPVACGPAKTSATFTPYSGTAPVSGASSAQVGSADGRPCAGPPAFAPSFQAGAASNVAGKPTSFAAVVSRRDGEALPDRFEVAFPAGMSAALTTVALCSGADAARGACQRASRIGSAGAELGPGANPVRLEGDAFLTGPYRRSPYGMVLVFKAQIGPVDLGTLVVRGAIRIDAETGRMSVITDPLPRFVEGIGVRFQRIELAVDRPGFLRNPTGCRPTSVAATILSVSGKSVRRDEPFRARGCVRLPFRPAFAMALTGKSELHRGGKPGLAIAARLRAGDANPRNLDFTLPSQLELDRSGARALCARREAQKGNCPAGAKVGVALARTPQLKEPLRGAVFAAQPQGSGSPELWTHLEGGGISLSLQSSTAADEDGRLHTTMADLPDMPLSTLRMRLFSGERGILALARGACRGGGPRGEAQSEGQNGVRGRARMQVQVRPGCK